LYALLAGLFLPSCLVQEERAPGENLRSIGGAEPTPTPVPLDISGTPGTAAGIDYLYTFTPARTGAVGESVAYSISNKPAWATFNTSTGGLSGYPNASGTFSGITISAQASTSADSLSPFAITVTTDPLVGFAWHIQNTGQTNFSASGGTVGVDLDVLPVWRQGYTGSGIRVGVSDSGLEIAHEDLAANIENGASKNYFGVSPWVGDPTYPDANVDGDHGTAVAGIIAAVGWNSKGSRGVAPHATLAGYNVLAPTLATTWAMLIDAISQDDDVVNMSWGGTADSDSVLNPAYETALVNAATNGRSGRGTVYVKSAGNAFTPDAGATYRTRPATADVYSATRFKIIVGALNATGVKSSYSSVGSNLWISNFGGEYGSASPAIMSTDRSSCTRGYSKTGAVGNNFQDGDATYNVACNYTSTMNGTSSAAPMTSGVVALMLQANPTLTWRDVRRILALTATQPQPGFAAVSGRAQDPAGHVWEQAWVTNAAGFKFHNYYGFGQVNAEAAVNLAKTYSENLGTEITGLASESPNSAIPDNSAVGVSRTLNFGTSMTVETVKVTLSVTHPLTGDLGVELTSPSGTKSILFHVNNSFSADANWAGFDLFSNAFYGEAAQGNWILKVIDGTNTNTGTLTSWSLRIWGR
jgi:subtilisin family serine protease